MVVVATVVPMMIMMNMAMLHETIQAEEAGIDDAVNVIVLMITSANSCQI